MKRALVPVVLLTLVACDSARDPVSYESSDLRNPQIPEIGSPGNAGGPVGIVVLDAAASPAAVAREHGIRVDYTYSAVLNGFAGRISDAAKAGLLRDGRIRSIEPDRAYTLQSSTPAPSWGIDRIDERAGTDGMYSFQRGGVGVTAYVVDTGIRYSHHDFGGRARMGFDAFGGDGVDCNGHGTHVSGTIGGASYGVARGVSLVGVRVLNCAGSGTTATVLAGLDWVLNHAARPAVVNMSLGGAVDSLVDTAVRRLTASSITVVVAAGNSGGDACGLSPAHVPEAITVGATSADDSRAGWSNWGNCVDLFAPGDQIVSDSWSSDDAVATMSGTSMASPHVAGAAALVLGSHPAATPQDVADSLAWSSTKGAVTSAFSPHSDLLYTGDDGTDGYGGDVPPVAAFTFVCTGTTCSFTDGSTDSDDGLVGWQWSFGDGFGDIDRNPTHTFAASGFYPVTLTVRDASGVSTSVTRSVAAGDVAPAPSPVDSTALPPDTGSVPTNNPPTADFTASCSGLLCSFLDGSSDPDGSIARWSWDFGDGASSVTTASTPAQHGFPGSGVYTVQLTVTDDAGASAVASRSVSVGVLLTATGSRQKGKHVIDAAWTGATTPKVDVYLDGSVVAAPKNSGSYQLQLSGRGQGSYVVMVCETGGGLCSNQQTVTF